ncbi:unnamed protein product [Acidithrix sp. C25]|nr:unnamed protein product [Acidithrix sp. C25]
MVLTPLFELDGSKPAKAGAIAKIARDHLVDENVVNQLNSERKARVFNASESINRIKPVGDTASVNEHELDGRVIESKWCFSRRPRAMAQHLSVSL